jgi:membrane AbrB-like protein
LWVPNVLVQAGYMLIGWQAGVVFTRESLRAVSRMLPAAILLIVILGVATAGLGMVLAEFTGKTPLEGYLATSPGGVYAVLAIAAETGSGVTFIIAAQVFRVLLMLFTAPFLARTVIRLTERHARRHNRSITDANKEPVRAAD